MSAQDIETLLSSADNDWRTPPVIFSWLHEEFGFTLDAAASRENHLCPRYRSQDGDDGLLSSWVQDDGTPEVAFVNPPYGRDAQRQSLQAPWFYMAASQARLYHTTSVLLVPARPDTSWWHATVPEALEVRFVRGRLNFLRADGGKASGGTFPTAIVVFGPPRTWDDVHRRGPHFRFVEVPGRRYLQTARKAA